MVTTISLMSSRLLLIVTVDHVPFRPHVGGVCAAAGGVALLCPLCPALQERAPVDVLSQPAGGNGPAIWLVSCHCVIWLVLVFRPPSSTEPGDTYVDFPGPPWEGWATTLSYATPSLPLTLLPLPPSLPEEQAHQGGRAYRESRLATPVPRVL